MDTLQVLTTEKNMCSASRRLKTVRLCSVVWLRNRGFSLQCFTIRRCLTSHIVTTQPLLFGSWLFLSDGAPKEGGGWSGGFGQLRHMDLYLAADRIFYLLILLVFFLKGSRCRTPPWISPTLVGQKNVGKGVPAPLPGSVIYCDIFCGSSKSYCDSELLVSRGQAFL